MNAASLRALVVVEARDRDLITNVLRDYGDEPLVARDASDALALCARHRLDVALITVSSQSPGSLALVHHITALHPNVQVIGLAHPEEWSRIADATALGITGSVALPATGDGILVALQRVRERKVLLDERGTLTAQERAMRRRAATYARISTLVSETDIASIALRVLDATSAEVPARAAAVYLPNAAGQLRRTATNGESASFAREIDANEVSQGAIDAVIHEGDRVRLVIFGDAELLGVVELAGTTKEPLERETRESLGIVAAIASGAIRAARRFEALARVGVKDPDTSAYTYAYFGDVAGREIDRAARHGRRFSLLTLTLDAGRNRPELGSTIPRDVAECVLASVRDSDVLARVEDDEFYLLLPETGLLGALACRRRIDEQLRAFKARKVEEQADFGELDVSIGVAVFPADGSDLGRLLRGSRRSAEEAATGVRRTLGLANASLWQAIDSLLGGADDTGISRDGTISLHADLSRAQDDVGMSRHAALARSTLASIAYTVASDAVRRSAAGAIYASAGDEGVAHAIAAATEGFTGSSTRAWVLGPSRDPHDRAAHIRLPIEDPRLLETAFFFCLTELGGYAVVARTIAPQTVLAYHTADLDVVDALVSALQGAYHLQPEVR